jgi:hypothetical protein
VSQSDGLFDVSAVGLQSDRVCKDSCFERASVSAFWEEVRRTDDPGHLGENVRRVVGICAMLHSS